ncbi:MAG: CBS domain-containing protein [Acidimicrobiia bacterium]
MDIDPRSPIRALVWTDPVAVEPGATLRALAGLLTEYGIGVVVVRRGADAVGVVSERDVVAAIGERGDPDVMTVADVMSNDVISVTPDTPVFEVALRMVDANLRHLAVAEGDDIVGIVSIKDIVRVLTEAGE